MVEQQAVQSNDLEMLREIALQGTQKAAESLGLFSGNTLTVSGAHAFVAQVEQIPYLFGDPEEVVVGIDFGISGDLDGFVMACFSLVDASRLIESLVGTPVTTFVRLQEMELSALGEAGNIIVSSFLVSLEHSCGVVVMPSPPSVAIEMAGAVLTSAAMPLAEEQGEVIVIEASIIPQDPSVTTAVSCRIQFLPTASAWCVLRESFARVRDRTRA